MLFDFRENIINDLFVGETLAVFLDKPALAIFESVVYTFERNALFNADILLADFLFHGKRSFQHVQ